MMKDDRKLVIYLVCVGIATVFWFLNALNKDYTVELTFPVKYTNLPTNKVLANEPPDRFVLKVNAYGFTILRHKLSMAFSPLVFNVNEFTGAKMEKSSSSSFAIASKQFINPLSQQVSNELKIIEIQPDTLYFKFDRIVQRKVKVKPNVSYELKQQHYLNDDITTKPDSVLVSGPESILDTIQFVSTKKQHYKELDQTVQRNVALAEYNKLDCAPKRVVLNIPVEEFTEKQVIVPLSISGKPDSLHINLFPDKVRVNFLTSLTQFSEISPNDFRITVDYNQILEKAEMLPITVEMQPPHILSVSVTPKKVEYLIEK